ncbi:hypothetical protein A6770_13655 [Nostoc minutum NIES-26]|uniref:Spore coat protein U domain-containing protein n=1 Tax=Nostoc minutum NIES-26 TaxID=1844469 RepID=A0A367RPA4_9NOSO|nr:hypothetical protein A6770_13655 [Nostoc minutum NIES-26]
MIRKSLIASAVILCGTVAFSCVAKAGSADVHFTANVPSSCTFSNVTNGTLGLNVAGTTLSSIASGTAGSATLTMRLAPGTYRLDLDPAGFPPDWQAAVNAYAVDVVAGSLYTCFSATHQVVYDIWHCNGC